MPSSSRNCHAPVLIGLPVHATVPRFRDIRWRYCSRSEEQPAARLGASLLRLGVCRNEDWTGSAVDFVERGFNRFCLANGVADARKIWEGNLAVMDHIFELTERERNDVEGDRDGPPQRLYVVADFTSAACIPIGSALSHLKQEHSRLPAAFYAAFDHLLWKWMRVYDYSRAHEYAEMSMIDMDEEQLKDSPYPRVNSEVPACLIAPSIDPAAPPLDPGRRSFPNKLIRPDPSRAFALLQELYPRLRRSTSRHLVGVLLEMQEHSLGRSHAWPYSLERRIPGLEEYLEESDGVGPGCLLNWYEGDAIGACFDEEMSYLGQNGPLAPSILLHINLQQSTPALDAQVSRVFAYVGAMLRSLAAAAKLVELIRELYDEHLREHRIQSGLQTQPCPSGLREE